jgi:DNA-binding FrmR family transcriptional regulator
MAGYFRSKEDLLARLRRIEGQVRGLQRMVEGDSYCIDVLTQITSVDGALKKVAVALLEDHIRHCVTEGIAADEDRGDELVTEASAAIGRLVRA